MTTEEAIDFLNTDDFESAGFAEATGIAIKALEKQTPKKPTYITEHNILYFDWKCPNCGREFVDATHGVNHCVDCGQAIDWSEE